VAQPEARAARGPAGGGGQQDGPGPAWEAGSGTALLGSPRAPHGRRPRTSCARQSPNSVPGGRGPVLYAKGTKSPTDSASDLPRGRHL